MKYAKSSLLLCLVTILFGCSSEEEIDFTGTYSVASYQEKCSDVSRNLRSYSGIEGICTTIHGDEECLDFTFNLNADGTYNKITTSITIEGDSIKSITTSTTSGTYTSRLNTIEFTGEFSAIMKLDHVDNSLKWEIDSKKPRGCARAYVLNKTS